MIERNERTERTEKNERIKKAPQKLKGATGTAALMTLTQSASAALPTSSRVQMASVDLLAITDLRRIAVEIG